MAKSDDSVERKAYGGDIFTTDYDSVLESIVKETLNKSGYRRGIITTGHFWNTPTIHSIVTTPPYFVTDGYNPNIFVGKHSTLKLSSFEEGVDNISIDDNGYEFAKTQSTIDGSALMLSIGGSRVVIFDKHSVFPQTQIYASIKSLWDTMADIDSYLSDRAEIYENLNIFLMDDDKTVRSLFDKINLIKGRELFRTFSSPSELLSTRTRVQPDAIILDLFTKETSDEYALKMFHYEVEAKFSAPRYIISGAYFGNDISERAKGFFQKPISPMRIINKIVSDILDMRRTQRLSPFIVNITGATGTAKSELASNIIRHYQEFSFPTMITDRPAREGEEGPTSYLHLPENVISALAKEKIVSVLHKYGDDSKAGGLSPNGTYAILHRKGGAEGHKEENWLTHIFGDSHPMSEVLGAGRIAITTLSGINHRLVGEEYSKVLNFELMPPIDENLNFHNRRGTPHRKLKSLLDRVELSESDIDGTHIYLVNRHLLDGQPETLEYRLDSIASSLRDHARMFVGLGFPKTTNDYFSGLVYRTVSSVLGYGTDMVNSTSDALKIIDSEHKDDYWRLKFMTKGSYVIDVLDFQKIEDREHYVLVLGNSIAINDRARISHAHDTKSDYISLKKKIISDTIIDAVGETYLMKSDHAQHSESVDSQIYFPNSTGLVLPNKDTYDFVMEFGSQMMIRDGVIEDIPALTVLLATLHDRKNDRFSFISPDEVEFIYELNPSNSRIYSGHFGRYFNYKDAKKRLNMIELSSHSSKV